jgi:preprotein translocase subunit SecG
MAGLLLGLHVLISFALIVVVLLQSGKGGGLAGAFGGGGGMGAVFGGQAAATFLTKATRYLATAFMITALSMALVVKTRTEGTVASEVQNLEPVPASAAGDVVAPEGTEGAPEGMPEAIPQTPPGAGEGGSEAAPPSTPEGD